MELLDASRTAAVSADRSSRVRRKRGYVLLESFIPAFLRLTQIMHTLNRKRSPFGGVMELSQKWIGDSVHGHLDVVLVDVGPRQVFLEQATSDWPHSGEVVPYKLS